MIKRAIVLVFCFSVLFEFILAKPSNLSDHASEGIDEHVQEAFFAAVQNGNGEAVRQLTTTQIINIVDESKMSALHWAITNGNEDIAKYLIENGANIEKVNNRGETALILSSSKGNLDMVKLLLIQNASMIDAADKNRDTALIWSASNGYTDIVKLLIEKGAAIDKANKKGQTALQWAAIDGYTDVLNLLIASGADIEKRNNKQETALMWGAMSGYDAIVQILLDNEANINSTNVNGDSALMLAARAGELVVVEQLIEHGANINIVNHENSSALIESIISEFDSVAEFLIQKGSDINFVGKDGKTAAMWAASMGSEIVVQALIENGANTNALDNKNNSALIFAGDKGDEAIISLLIENGADLNAVNNENNSALIASIISGSGLHNASKLLIIQKGANLNLIGQDGKTAAMWSASKGFIEIIQSLIQNVAKLNIVNRDGYSVLDYASNLTDGREEMIRLLEQHGAEYGGILLYRGTAQKACRLYSNQTARWYNEMGTWDSLVGSRVLDGSLVYAGEFPWMVALGYLNAQYKISFSCGGTLISDLFVLTAAHCVKDIRRPVVARLGKITLTDEDDFRAENQNIREIIPHPKYSIKTKKNDIALIRLVERLWISEFTQPACLETNLRDDDASTQLIVTGWGQINASSTSTTLLKINLKTMPLHECNTTLLQYNEMRDLPVFQNGISDSQYCAYDPIGNQDSCQGDSGGPLQTMQSYAKLSKVVGIVSFGIGCGQGLPAIYTRVAYYISWIGSHVWPKGKIETLRIYTNDDNNNSDDYKYILL